MKIKLIILFVIAAPIILAAHAFSMSTPPAASPEVVPVNFESVQEIRIVAKQFEYVPSSVVVKKGIPVRIILSSQDVTHGFAIDAFNVHASVEKGKDTIVNFTPDKAGTYDYYCTVFCGIGHLGMRGKLIVN
jgi:nitrosocyanin